MVTTTSNTETPAEKALEGLPPLGWALLSLLYAAAWLVAVIPSHSFWFLPAGLRLATLWLLPAKRWFWLLLAEGWVAAFFAWHVNAPLVDPKRFAPLLIYALAIYLVRGPDRSPSFNNPRVMRSLLLGGILSALAASPVLSFLYNNAFATVGLDPSTWGSLFAFFYGDLIGQLILAPILVLFCSSARSSLKDWGLWRSVLVAGTATALVLLMLHYHMELAPFLLLLIFVPMFLVAFRKSWQGAALSVAVTGILFEIFLNTNPAPLEITTMQLAFALFSAGSLMLGSAMSALRDSHLSLQLQHQHMARMNAELVEAGVELRDVSQRLVRLEEQGQRELADELDVELGQSLHTLGTHLSLAVRTVKEQETLKILFNIREKAREMEDSLRRVVRQLRPKALDNKGLKEALNNGPLHEVLDDAGIVMETHFVGQLISLQEDEKTAIYRICQTLTRKAIGLGGINKLRISVQVLGEQEFNCEVCLDIEMSPVPIEQADKNLAPLQPVEDRVLALNGIYDVQILDNRLIHHIVFRQKALRSA